MTADLHGEVTRTTPTEVINRRRARRAVWLMSAVALGTAGGYLLALDAALVVIVCVFLASASVLAWELRRDPLPPDPHRSPPRHLAAAPPARLRCVMHVGDRRCRRPAEPGLLRCDRHARVPVPDPAGGEDVLADPPDLGIDLDTDLGADLGADLDSDAATYGRHAAPPG